MSFDSLHPVVQHQVVNTLGWSSLRPLQESAIEPLLLGNDALLLAPTAGGKTEAAIFPVLSLMASADWRGLSVLYICPLRALLNNLEPRLQSYAQWLGRRVGLWHGDTTASARRRLASDLPDILLTTPESLEAMLVSTLLTPSDLFAQLRVVVVDEVHAFAGDDRGWHLLAVLERVAAIAGRPLQRIGLSATVGNPADLLTWLQGASAATRPASVVAPAAGSAASSVEAELDYVGSIGNAATVIAALHGGEKRLVFADSRRSVEELALALRARGVATFVSHSSLSVDERRQAELAFAEARDCVIVSTSTLELGIDVGDLDRVLQIGAPLTVASLLQRLGRSGRRAGTVRSILMLAVDDDQLLRAAGVLRLWSEGYVEPILPPPYPRHVLAQQLLALCLERGRVPRHGWDADLRALMLAAPSEVVAITDWMLERGFVDEDSGMIFVGPSAEKHFGRKNFLELLSLFTSDPQFTVLHGRVEVGSVDPMVMTRKVDGPRVLALGGRSWQVSYIDWKRRRAFVEPSKLTGHARWSGSSQPLSFALVDAMRRVALGAELPGVRLTRRATERLAIVREDVASTVDTSATVLAQHDSAQVRWWTWAGGRANATVAATLSNLRPGLVDELDRYDNRYLRLRSDASAVDVGEAIARLNEQAFQSISPDVSSEALRQLKFSELLPPELAASTLAARGADVGGLQQALRKRVIAR